MKRIFIAAMIVMLSNSNVSATHYYQSLCSRISGVGKSIENVNNVPVIGKLTNLLPIAALAASLKECPMQTMLILTALGIYVVSQNEAVHAIMNKYEISNNMPWIKRNYINEQIIDDMFFVFDGDEEDLELSEDDLLGSDLFSDEYDDERKATRREVR